MKIVTLIIVVVGFLITFALGAQNEAVVHFNYLVAQGDFKLSTILGITFGTGFIIGWIICGLLYIKVRFSYKRLMKKMAKQEQELEVLRATPVKE